MEALLNNSRKQTEYHSAVFLVAMSCWHAMPLFPVCLCIASWIVITFAQTYEDEQFLLQTLFANYSPAIRPVDQQSQPTAVKADFRLNEIISFDDRKGVLKTISYLIISWVDEKMRWDRAVYDIGYIYVLSSSVWKPRLLLTNSASEHLQIQSGDSIDGQVRYFSDGRAYYSYNGLTTTRCDANILYFPFDKHICELTFVSYEPTSRVFLLFQNLDFVLPKYNNKEWDVLTVTKRQFEIMVASGVNQSCFRVTIQFKRKPGFVILNTFLPIPCFGFINILAFLLPESSGERVSFSITILLTLVFFLNLVSECLPPVSDPISIFNVIIMTQMQNSFLIVVTTLFSLVAFERGQRDAEVPYTLRRIVLSIKKFVSKKNKVYSSTIPTTQREEDAHSVRETDDESSARKKDQERVPNDRQLTWNDVSDVTNTFCLRLFLLIFSVEWSVYLILMIFYWCNYSLI